MFPERPGFSDVLSTLSWVTLSERHLGTRTHRAQPIHGRWTQKNKQVWVKRDRVHTRHGSRLPFMANAGISSRKRKQWSRYRTGDLALLNGTVKEMWVKVK